RVDSDARRQDRPIGDEETRHLEAFAERIDDAETCIPRHARATERVERDALDSPSVDWRPLETPHFVHRANRALTENREIDLSRTTGESHLGEDGHRVAEVREILRSHSIGQDGLAARTEAHAPSALVVHHRAENTVTRHLLDPAAVGRTDPG